MNPYLHKQRQAQLLIGYGAILLQKIGDYTIVSIEAPDGTWVEVIKELLDTNFSHCVHPIGIEEKLNRLGIDCTKNPNEHLRTPKTKLN